MLLPNEMDHLVRQERYEDLKHKQEQAHLIAAAQAGLKQDSTRKVIGWLGAQMVQVGEKLEAYGTTSAHKLAR
jgi:hypothetical protein